MSPAAFVLWTALVALLVVLAFAARAAIAALGQLNRLGSRVDSYADLPVVAALARAEGDAQRIEAALAGFAPLALRARAACAAILRGPIPPQVITAFIVVRRELAAFLRYARR